ncbi:MFS transporter [Pseudomonas sp. LRF_L74]|uniref:MFS transporter n=1 Tax=Pseudomonas sp. LRF_L74 TaxID=3369422 RepID=UPI003F6360DF
MLALLACAQLIIALDATILFVALPSIGEQLAFSAQQLQWVISAYSVAFGGCLLLGGRCADLLGRRRMYRIGQTLFALASLAGGCTDSPLLLVLARAVQGVGAAMLFPATLALINTHFAEGPPRTRALAIWSAASAAGLALGALLGGVLTQWFGWEAVFLVNVPLAAACAWGAGRWIAADAARESGRRFDLPGAICVTAGGCLLVLGFIQGPEWGWQSPGLIVAFVLALLLLAAFIHIERTTTDPLMHLDLLRQRSLWLAMLITAVFMSSYGVQYYFLAIYYQRVYGFSVLQTGLAFLPATLFCTVGIALAERLLARFGARSSLIIGLLAGAAGIAWQTTGLVRVDSYTSLLPAILLLSLGQGITWTSMWVCAGQGVPAAQQGVASGMASTVQQIGGALGLAVLVSLANAASDSVDGMDRALWCSALVALAGAGLAIALPGRRAKGSSCQCLGTDG